MKSMTATTVLLALVLLGVPGIALASDHDDGDGAEWHWFGNIRMRPEYNDNLSDVSSGRDDKIAYSAYRANLGFSVDLDRDVTVLLDGQVVGLWGEDSPLKGEPSVDSTSAKFNMYRAYAEARDIMGTPFSVRAGRQTLVFGDEWLMGDRDFYGGTSFDGLRGWFKHDGGNTSFFWAKLAETNTPEAIGSGGPTSAGDVGGDFSLYGAWTDWLFAEQHSLDVGLVYLFDHRTMGGFPWQDKRWTLTTRYGFDEEEGRGGFAHLNLATQWGDTVDVAGASQVEIKHAWAFEATGGYIWQRERGSYKVFGRLAEYTGDEGDTPDNETFNPLFQDFHGRYGYLDFWHGLWGFTQFIGGTPGMEILQLGTEADLPSGLRLSILAQQMKRGEAASTGTNRNLGEEYALVAAYDYGENTTIELGVAQLYPGTAFGAEPPLFAGTTVRRVYVNLQARF